MKIQIIENISNEERKIVYTTCVVAKETTLSSCTTATLNKGTDAYETALAELKGESQQTKVYKEFDAEDEGDVKTFIEDLCYDEWIEKKLKWVDFDEIKES